MHTVMTSATFGSSSTIRILSSDGFAVHVSVKLRSIFLANWWVASVISVLGCAAQVNSVFKSVGELDCVPRGHLGPMTTASLWPSNQTTNEDWSAPARRC